jgi:hypothetical protein
MFDLGYILEFVINGLYDGSIYRTLIIINKKY